jgi:poly(3-hydroxybutyrate) depolymerase
MARDRSTPPGISPGGYPFVGPIVYPLDPEKSIGSGEKMTKLWMTRRETIRLLGCASGGAWFGAARESRNFLPAASAWATKEESSPRLAAGSPTSAERTALIEVFRKQSEGLEEKYEARTHNGDWVMPYRLFRPEASGKLPLAIYLHGSGGQGDDNRKQLGLGNIFGTRIWLLPENQKSHPCYVLAPQSNRGWVRYDPAKLDKGVYEMVAGVGQGVGMALEVVDALRHEFAIDERRIYVMGQSMGGAGAWNMIASRPKFFAAAVTCCGSSSKDDGTASIETPLWNFHGEADATVPVDISRERIAARRKVGGRPFSTEYAGVDHNVWEWAFTEPELGKWLFSQSRG